MREAWFDRLIAAVEDAERAGRSAGSISVAAGLGRNYVAQMKKQGKKPSVEIALRLARELGVSYTYLLTGADVTPEEEELLQRWSQLRDQEKQGFLALLRSLREMSSDESPS